MTNWYSILMLIGPSGAGKTHFYNEFLKPQLDQLQSSLKEPLRVVYLSSDEIRRQIIGFNAHKMSPEMMAASPEAFKILTERLKMSTSYPHNAHVVIIDSTGLSEDFRKEVTQIGQTNNYGVEAVVFDYKEISEYLPKTNVEDEYSYQQKRVTMEHVKRLRQEVMKTLSKKVYTQVHKIKSQEDMINFKIQVNPQDLNKHFFPAQTYTMIGDIHGCLDALLQLLAKLQVEVTDGVITVVPETVGRLVLLGDLIDKGTQSGAVVEFVHKNLDKFLIVQGNHEQFVVNEIQKSSGLDEAFKREYFNSFYELTNEQKNQLKEIYLQALNFIKTPRFILTHAPVQKRYLGKLDKVSQKLMRKTPFMKSKKDFPVMADYVKYLEEQFSYLQEEKHRNHPYHIFGHLVFPRAMKWDNKIALDSGAVYGGALSALTVNDWGRITFTTLKTPEVAAFSSEGIVAPFCEKEIKSIELSEFDKERVRILAKNKVQFISGTIAPADRDLETNCLESLAKALNYYKEKNVKRVNLQTKHMGSRGNIYLNRDLEKCCAVSRNGFLMKLDLTEIYKKMLIRHQAFMDENEVETMILDGELMPWSALGKGLIQEQYQVIGHGVKSEIQSLKEAGFEEALQALSQHPKKADFDSEVNQVSKNKLVDKYGYQLYHTLSALKKVKINLNADEAHIEEYIKQVDLYGAEKEIDFLPFMLLKTIHKDGSEKVWMSETIKTEDNYSLVSDKSFLTIDLDDPQSLTKAQVFFDEQVDKGEEGIVIKPEFTFTPGVVPFIKVRNEEYLRIIYGFNYKEPEIYNTLVQSKKVGKKMKISANEYRIAKQMLEIPVNEISPENERYATLIGQMIAEEAEEQKVDYRL